MKKPSCLRLLKFEQVLIYPDVEVRPVLNEESSPSGVEGDVQPPLVHHEGQESPYRDVGVVRQLGVNQLALVSFF